MQIINGLNDTANDKMRLTFVESPCHTALEWRKTHFFCLQNSYVQSRSSIVFAQHAQKRIKKLWKANSISKLECPEF